MLEKREISKNSENLVPIWSRSGPDMPCRPIASRMAIMQMMEQLGFGKHMAQMEGSKWPQTQLIANGSANWKRDAIYSHGESAIACAIWKQQMRQAAYSLPQVGTKADQNTAVARPTDCMGS